MRRAAWIGLPFLLLACGPARPVGTSCVDTTFCDKGLLCHPLAKLCVKTCSSPADCPSTQKQCAGVAHADGGMGEAFCQCGASAECNDKELVCGDEERICVARCRSDVDCTFNRRCDSSAGVCKVRS